MANFLRGLGRTLGTAAGTAGAAIGGYQQDQADAIKRALLAEQERRAAEAFSLSQKVGTANLAESDLGMKVKQAQLTEGSFQASPEFAELVKRARTGDQAAQAQVIARVPQMGSQFLQGDRPEDVAKGSYEALKLAYPNHPVSATAYRPGVDYGKVFSQAQAEDAQQAMSTRQTTALTQQQAAADTKKEQASERLLKSERSAYQNNPLVKDAYQVATGLTPARVGLQNETPLGDLMALYAVVKMFDPGSVVKEGEIKLAQSANSLPDKVRLMWMETKAGRKVTPYYRKQIASLIDSTVAARRDIIAPVQAQFGAAARTYGLDSAQVAPDPFIRGSDTAKPGGVNVVGLIKSNRPAAGRP